MSLKEGLTMPYQLFDSFEDAMEKMDVMRAQADARVNEWQASLKAGDAFVYRSADGEAYTGEVLDPVAMAGDDEDSLEEAAIYNEEHMKHYRFCRIFGSLHPKGFMLDIHVSALSPAV